MCNIDQVLKMFDYEARTRSFRLKPDIVHGDTTAFYNKIKVGHVDLYSPWPEEANYRCFS